MRTERTETEVTEQDWHDAQAVWDYHQVGHTPRRCDVAIGLGSHDLGVAATAVELYQQDLFPLIVFSGATSPTTRDRFPRGEAVHYREYAIEHGVPDEAILVETQATNTGANFTGTRHALAAAGQHPASALVICKPYMQRRALATAGKAWPDLEVVCASEKLTLADYTTGIGDEHLVIDMLVGDLQRVIEYPRLGFAVEQHVPPDVHDAYQRLVARGYTSRLIR